MSCNIGARSKKQDLKLVRWSKLILMFLSCIPQNLWKVSLSWKLKQANLFKNFILKVWLVKKLTDLLNDSSKVLFDWCFGSHFVGNSVKSPCISKLQKNQKCKKLTRNSFHGIFADWKLFTSKRQLSDVAERPTRSSGTWV